MNKILLFSLVLCFQAMFSQTTLQQNKLVRDGARYKFSQYVQVLHKAEAQSYFKKGRANKTAGDIFAGAGGFGMGLSLALILSSPKEQTVSTPLGSGTVTTDNSARWTVFGVSAGLALVSIPFYVSAKKNMDKAVQIENGEATAFEPYFKLEGTGNGVALSYNF